MNKMIRTLRSLLLNTRGEQLVSTLLLVAVVVTLGAAAMKVMGGAWGAKAGTQAGQITGL